jgi:hypothetical protein
MTCNDVRTQLADFVLGSLEGGDELDVRRHLPGCGSCRSQRDALREGLGGLASTPV